MRRSERSAPGSPATFLVRAQSSPAVRDISDPRTPALMKKGLPAAEKVLARPMTIEGRTDPGFGEFLRTSLRGNCTAQRS
jgi:hypothetical protein